MCFFCGPCTHLAWQPEAPTASPPAHQIPHAAPTHAYSRAPPCTCGSARSQQWPRPDTPHQAGGATAPRTDGHIRTAHTGTVPRPAEVLPGVPGYQWASLRALLAQAWFLDAAICHYGPVAANDCKISGDCLRCMQQAVDVPEIMRCESRPEVVGHTTTTPQRTPAVVFERFTWLTAHAIPQNVSS